VVPEKQLRTLIIRAEPFTGMAVISADIERMLKAQFGWTKETRTKLTLVGLEVIGSWKDIQSDGDALPDWDENSEDGMEHVSHQEDEEDENEGSISQLDVEPLI